MDECKPLDGGGGGGGEMVDVVGHALGNGGGSGSLTSPGKGDGPRSSCMKGSPFWSDSANMVWKPHTKYGYGYAYYLVGAPLCLTECLCVMFGNVTTRRYYSVLRFVGVPD